MISSVLKVPLNYRTLPIISFFFKGGFDGIKGSNSKNFYEISHN